MATPPEPLMRRVVLYVDSLKIGGAERVTLTFARWLRQNGWTPIVLTRQSRTLDFYPIPAGVERAVEPPDPRWLRLLGRWGFPWRVRRLRHWLRQQQVSLAIGMTTKPAVKLLLAAHPLRIPCAVSERNFPPLKPMAIPWGSLRRFSYRWASLHIVQTRATGEWLKQQLAAEPQLLLPNPVQWPLPRFEPELDPDHWLAEVGVAPEAPLLLAAGTKAHQKGFDLLVQAFADLLPRHPDLQLVILGLTQEPYHSSDQQKALLRLLRRHPDAQAQLHFPGRVGNMADWYRRCTLFVLPSRYEGFPNVLLEAMAEGCCCLAADCPHGPADLLRHNTDGLLLTKQATATSWSEAIDRLLRDPLQRQRLEAEAATVRQRFSDRALEAQLMQALGQLNG